MNSVSPVLRLIDRVSASQTVSAHCDIPCGIYDPHTAQVAALTPDQLDYLSQSQMSAMSTVQMRGFTANDLGSFVRPAHPSSWLILEEAAQEFDL